MELHLDWYPDQAPEDVDFDGMVLALVAKYSEDGIVDFDAGTWLAGRHRRDMQFQLPDDGRADDCEDAVTKMFRNVLNGSKDDWSVRLVEDGEETDDD